MDLVALPMIDELNTGAVGRTELVGTPDVKNAIQVTHSTAVGKVAHFIGRHGPKCDGENVSDATQLLSSIEQGSPDAAEQLLVLVYEELRRLAAHQTSQQAPGQTLQATALVHEAWLRLVGKQNASLKDRSHFFLAAAGAMRHILIDRARRKANGTSRGALSSEWSSTRLNWLLQPPRTNFWPRMRRWTNWR
jgi:hypothetical protein